MAQPIDFLYYLRKKNGVSYDYYYVDNLGNVTFQTSLVPARPLEFAPDLWWDKLLDWQRNFETFGVFRAMAMTFKFVKDGAKILRYIKVNEGVEGELEMYIEKFDTETMTIPNILDWKYKPYYYANIDFQTYINTDNNVNINLIEGGFFTDYKARNTTTYELDIDQNTNKKWVKLHECYLQCLAKWVAIGAGQISTFNSLQWNPSLNFTIFEGINSDGQGGFTKFNDVDIPTNIRAFLVNQTTVPISYNLSIDGSLIITNNSGIDCTVNLFVSLLDTSNNQTGAFVSIPVSAVVIPTGTTQVVSITPINTFMIVPAGFKLALSCELNSFPNGNAQFNNVWSLSGGNVNLKVDFGNPIKENYFPALTIGQVFKELVDKMTETITIPSTTMFDILHSDKLITSGDAIRNLPNSKLKISFQDFLKSVNAVFNTSLVYNRVLGEVYLEEKANAYQQTQIADLGEVSKFEESFLTSEMFVNINNGFNSQTYDEVNGKDEFNTLTQRLSPIKKVVQDKDLKSEIRADMYGIILTSLNLNSKEVTDADSDNDAFFLHIDDDAIAGQIPSGYVGAGEDYYNLYRKPIDLTAGANFWIITGIYKPEAAFNIFYTPTRSIYRHGNWMRSVFHLLETKYLKFQTNTKSNATAQKLVTFEGSPITTIDEGADILISTLDTPLFLPYIFQFETKVNQDLFDIFNSNPYGYVKFRWQESDYYGYILRASQEPATDKPQTFKLLAHPLTNLNNLIY